jgi:hypothetical protein
MLEATVIPLSSLPTAHPSPEAARTPAAVRPPVDRSPVPTPLAPSRFSRPMRLEERRPSDLVRLAA